MLEKLSGPSIRVIMYAQEESRRLGHNFVGTEQILLGLIREGRGVASKRLAEAGITLDLARFEVEKITGRGNGNVSIEIPFTPRAKRVLELSWKEASRLNDNAIRTEHLLLGLLAEGEGVAVRVLQHLNVERIQLRQLVLESIGGKECDLPDTPVVPTEVTNNYASGDFSWYTPEAVSTVQRAWGIAETFGAELISEEHLCLALLRDAELATVALSLPGMDLTELRKHLLGKLQTGNAVGALSKRFSPEAMKILEQAWHHSAKHKLGWVTSETILLSALHDPEGAFCQALRAVNVDLDATAKAVVDSIDKGRDGVDKLDKAPIPRSSIVRNLTPVFSKRVIAVIGFVALVALALTMQTLYLSNPTFYVIAATILWVVCVLLLGMILLRRVCRP